jgi:hypothetical protein
LCSGNTPPSSPQKLLPPSSRCIIPRAVPAIVRAVRTPTPDLTRNRPARPTEVFNVPGDTWPGGGEFGTIDARAGEHQRHHRLEPRAIGQPINVPVQ